MPLPAQARILLLALSQSLLLAPSHALPTPSEVRHKHHHPEDDPGRKAANFSRDFATALAVAIVAVIIGTTLICVFAHCWQQILDWACDLRSSRSSSSVTRERRWRRRKDEEAWFCGPDRGLPMPHFEILASGDESVPLSMAVSGERWGEGAVPAVYSRLGARGRAEVSRSGLPSWFDAEEVERPASVACFLDRP
ncbi:hypothetical protein GGS21DRAFT_281751 [Xylaria nigripes]|nr:hypothetical protein GGS21DRAFT_281751 [Xylaria nigripes]